jgi:hypothetical protein
MVWKTPAPDDKLALVREVNKIETAYRFVPEESVVETLVLSFYGDSLLFSIAKPAIKGPPLWYVKLPAETVSLDGSVANIHHLNANAPLTLSAQNIADYLKFHLYFTKQGWLEGVVAHESGNAFTAKARVLEKDGVYESTLAVSWRGEVTVVSREKIGLADRKVPEQFGL